MSKQRERKTSPTVVPKVPAENPRWLLGGWVALAVATPLVPGEGAVDLGVHVMLVAMWLVLLFGWFCIRISRPRWTVQWDRTTIAVLLFCGWQVLSGLLMAEHGNFRYALNVIWLWVAVGAMVFLGRQLVREAMVVRAVLVVMVGMAICLCAVAVYQISYSMPRLRAAYERDPERALLEAGYVVPPNSPVREHFRNRVESKEPLATFALANSFAGFLVPWLVIVLGIAVSVRWPKNHSAEGAKSILGPPAAAPAKSLAVLSGVGLLLLAMLLLTRSRSGILGLACGVVLLAWNCRPSGWRPSWRLVSGGVMFMAALILGVFWAKGFDSSDLRLMPTSLLYRLEYWRSSLAMIGEHPLVGCGGGNFQDYYTQYKSPLASESPRDPHNFLVEIAANSGVPGLLLLAGIVVCFVADMRVKKRAMIRDGNGLPGATPALVAEPVAAARETQRAETVYLGGLTGITAGWFLAFLVGFSGELIPLGPVWVPGLWLFGLPLAACWVWLADGWVRQGTISAEAVGVAIAALLFNLSAAGGIAFPGVAISLWMLLPLLLVLCDGPTWITRHDQISCGIALVGLVVLYCGFHWSEYTPILSGQSELNEGEVQLRRARELIPRKQTEVSRSSLETAMAKLENAARLDSWSHQPWIELAEAHQLLWVLSPRSTEVFQFERAAEKAERFNAHSAENFRHLGNLYFSAYRRFGLQKHLDDALRLYQGAVERNPTSSTMRAQFAWALSFDGQKSRAADEAAEALRLDGLMPDNSQKLGKFVLHDPGPEPGVPNPQPPPPPEGASAEPVMERLRNEQGTL